MTGQQLEKILKREGWMRVRTAQSLCEFLHKAKDGRLLAPVPGEQEVPAGTLRYIEKATGLTLRG